VQKSLRNKKAQRVLGHRLRRTGFLDTRRTFTQKCSKLFPNHIKDIKETRSREVEEQQQGRLRRVEAKEVKESISREVKNREARRGEKEKKGKK